MFEEFREQFGCRTNYLFAQMAAQNGDASSMVSCLDRVVQTSILGLREVDANKNWEKQAGMAFFKLAKALDEKGKVCREGAVLSLNYSLQYCDAGGMKPRLSGLSFQEIEDYRENPTSIVSLKTLEIVE